MAKPIVYGPGFSTYVRSTLLTLEEKGVDYDLEFVDMLTGAAGTEPHIRRQPFAKVPAFHHDGMDLYETVAIMRYVDEAFDGPALQPADAKARARMEQILSIVDSYAYDALIKSCVIPRVVAPMVGGETDEAAIGEARPAMTTCVAALNALHGDSGGPFLVGDAVSLADLHLTPVYAYFSTMPEAELLADAPALRGWWDAMKSRPSVVATEPELG